MANHSGRSTHSKPNWLLSGNRGSRPTCHSPAWFPTSNVQTSFSNHDHIQPQSHPSALQHEPEPPATAHYVISTPPSPSENPVACAAKRKAPNVAPRDEQRDCHSHHVTTILKGGGGRRPSGGISGNMIWINESEGAKIMMEATTALKNPTRRVTVSGGEFQSKRTRMAAIDSGESSCFLILLYVVLMITRRADTEPRLSWRRKIGGVPPPVVQLGPPGNQKGVDVDSAMDGVTPAQNDIDCLHGYGFGLGITDEDASSSKVQEKPGPALLNETIIPPRECVQLGLGAVSGQSSRGESARRNNVHRACQNEERI